MGDVVEPAEVIGRATELEAVERFVARAVHGETSLLLEGDAGIGKTSVWSAAITRAQTAGARIFRSAPSESERILTLGGLTDLLAHVTPSELAGLPPIQGRALEIALLRADATGPLPDQRTLSVAVTTLLRQLADVQTVIVAIDDAQWLDESSASILSYAMRRLSDRPIGVLVAVRGTLTGVAADVIAAVPSERRDRRSIGAMPLAGLHQLFLARFGRSFPRLVLVRIEAASGGNPFYALEIARALVDTGAIVTPGAPLPIPGSLEALVEARIHALPAPTRSALLFAALAAEPTLDVLRAVDGSAPAALEAAVAGGVVAIEGRTVRYSHPLLAQAVVSMAGPEELRGAHLRLAAATASDDARARHLAGATHGPDQRVASALAAAAATARDRGATLDAASLYERAARLTPSERPNESLARALLAAECLFVDVSEVVQADAILEAAIAGAPAGPRRAEALSLRALIRYYHGQTPDAVRLGEQALVEAGDAPVLRATVLGRYAFVAMQVDLERGFELVTEARRLLEPLVDDPGLSPDLLANILLLHASAALGLVRGIREDDIDRGTRLITAAGRSWEHEGADGSAFGLARHTDDLDRAIAMTDELIRAKSGPGGDDPFNLVQLSGLQLLRGDWAAARAGADAAVEGYAREGADVFPAWRLRGVALVAAHDGRVDEARRLATEGLALAAASGDLTLQVFHHHILGFVALSLGEVVDADAHLSEAARLAGATGTRHPGRFKLDGDRVEAALAVGDVDGARAIVAGLEHAAAVAPTPWVGAVGARAGGLLAAATGDLDGALAALGRAVTAHARLPMPFERGRTLLAKGQVHRRRKEKRLADETLHEALAIFEELGAPLWAQRAGAELGRVGRRPRATDDLTETERRVAVLAATGLSSREIAEQAFLAPKTVGNVLGRVYGKLGIHSRAELGAWMADGGVAARAGDRSG